ncbi:MAG: metallophosphoesterase family protein [Intestinibacter bartlettii]|uniref:metallophosphoesterase family protein n=1 Tax=Intestinibacter bartlettii TaxID=261299 RepID=UPI0026EDC489|nr:metallophosphoesterase family protein [Intestinibacter bartlettii]MDO5009256.1 metallophosphoesterase family protein [Intestinibacter bartlettii]
MIYITGDCHGDYERFNTENFPEQKHMTKDDFVIVCGDFGFWTPSKEQEKKLKWLSEKPFTTLFVDGNHECFDELYNFPIEEFCGGKVHFVKDSIIHLMRGQVFDLNGVKIFTFGGAKTDDMQAGVLDPSDPHFKLKKRKLDKEGAKYRIKHVSWWKDEMPNKYEYQYGLDNLEKHNWKVDYVITHCCPSSIQKVICDSEYKDNELTDYLDEIKTGLSYKNWIFGHYHDNKMINDKDILIYEQIIRIL